MTLTVADRLQLSELVHRYAAYVDAGRSDDVAELFTTTGQLVVPQPPDQLGPTVRHRGRAAVRAAMAALDDVARTHHGVVGEVYTAGASDDAATGSITAVAHHFVDRDGQATDLTWYLRYADEYLRTDAGWRIAQRALTIDAITTSPVRRLRS